MNARIHAVVRHALLVGPRELELLWQRLTGDYKVVAVTARCADDSTLEVSDLAELFAFENPTHRRMLRVELHAHNSDDDRASVAIGAAATPSNSAELSVDSSNEEVSIARMNRLVALLREMRPWHSFATRVNFAHGSWGALAAYGFWMLLTRRAGLASGRPVLSITESVGILLLTAALIVGLVWAVGKVQFWLAPHVFFPIGHQRSVWEARLKWRERLLLGLGFGILTCAVVAYFQATMP